MHADVPARYEWSYLHPAAFIRSWLPRELPAIPAVALANWAAPDPVPEPAPKPDRTPSLAARLELLIDGPGRRKRRPFRNHYPPDPAGLTRRQAKKRRRFARRLDEAIRGGSKVVADRLEWIGRYRGGDAVRPGTPV